MVAWHSCMAYMILDCIIFLHDIYFLFFNDFYFLMIFIFYFSKIPFIHLLNIIILCFYRKLTKEVWHRKKEERQHVYGCNESFVKRRNQSDEHESHFSF